MVTDIKGVTVLIRFVEVVDTPGWSLDGWMSVMVTSTMESTVDGSTVVGAAVVGAGEASEVKSAVVITAEGSVVKTASVVIVESSVVNTAAVVTGDVSGAEDWSPDDWSEADIFYYWRSSAKARSESKCDNGL